MPMDSEANTSLSSVCTARAMAMPPTPRLATSAVMLTPRLARIDSSMMVHTTRRTMMPISVVVTGLRALPLRVRPSTHRRTAMSAHRATWKARAMNQPCDRATSQRAGSSTTFKPISREKANSSRWLVWASICATIPSGRLAVASARLCSRLVTKDSATRSTQ